MIVVSDTTPIISLLKIGQIDLLQKLFESVVIPKAVYDELTVNNEFADEAEAIRESEYIKVADVSNRGAVDLLRRATGLDLGESEAIIYTDESKADLLLMDESKGRKVARQMGLNVAGTVGLLIEGYEEGYLDKDEILNAVSIMKGKGRHISDSLYELLLKKISG